MKKNTLLFAVIALLGCVSCKKSYVCTCTKVSTEPAYTFNSVNYPEEVNSTIEQEAYEEKKEENAVAKCSFKEYVITETSPNAAQGQEPTLVVNTCVVSEN